ncbi:MAG: cell division topological specificity factor MinE [Lachnospiraceae bacterium]|nr:cell division topological specificity factor MinE [Lachnospiraceae bacterium]MDY5869690.1 cell division topological specificity factor MinE [Lachnospiraceae bacterium]
MGIRNFFSRRKSREIAKDRLKILLISDRVNCSPEMMEMIKTDIAKVISKYMKIDTESMEIQISKTDRKGRDKIPTLYANIPILDLHKNVN